MIRKGVFNTKNIHLKYCVLILLSFFLLSCDFSNSSRNESAESNNIFNNKNSGRDTWQKPELVINTLGDISDKTIADIGAGTGYFTFRMAFEAKKVIAVEIDPTMINLIEVFKENLPIELKDKVETRLVDESNPGLNQGEADIAVIINTIAYIKETEKYLSLLKDQLAEGGSIMIVDFKERFIPIDAPPMSERIASEEVVMMLNNVGFRNIENNSSSLEYQYIITAEK